MKKCCDCGIGASQGNKVYCEKLKVYQKPINESESCTYFIEKQYEEGELLSPIAHLVFKEQELASRKMKGVI